MEQWTVRQPPYREKVFESAGAAFAEAATSLQLDRACTIEGPHDEVWTLVRRGLGKRVLLVQEV